MHFIGIGEGLYLGEGELVRKLDAKQYDIIGYSDGGTSNVVVAPNRRALLIFDNESYSNDSYVALVGIDSVDGQIDFKLLGVQYFKSSLSSIIWPENGNPILLFKPVYKGEDGWEGLATGYVELLISELVLK